MPGYRNFDGINPVLLQASNLFRVAPVFSVNFNEQDGPLFLVVEHHVRPG